MFIMQNPLIVHRSCYERLDCYFPLEIVPEKLIDPICKQETRWLIVKKFSYENVKKSAKMPPLGSEAKLERKSVYIFGSICGF